CTRRQVLSSTDTTTLEIYTLSLHDALPILIDLHHWLQSSHLDALMIMQVHDELVFEVAEKDVDELVKQVTKRMAAAAKLAVPLVADYGVGNNWDEAH